MTLPFTLFAATGYSFTLWAGPEGVPAVCTPMNLSFIQNAKLETTFQLNNYGTSDPRDLTGKTVTAYFIKKYPVYTVLATVGMTILGDPKLGQVKLSTTPTFNGQGILEIVEALGNDKTKFFPEVVFTGHPSQV